jgi:hypothetical protein
MNSSEEQAAAKQEAFEGLMKVIHKREVLFMLYYLQQLDALSLNQAGESTRLQSDSRTSLMPLLPYRSL